MKKSAVKAGLVVIVLAAGFVWFLFSKRFHPQSTEQQFSSEKIQNFLFQAAQQSQSKEISTSSAKVFNDHSSVSATVKEDSEEFAKSKFCRAQYEELLTIKTGADFRAIVKKNPTFIDKRCFQIPSPLKMDVMECYRTPPESAVLGKFGSENIQNTICHAFLIYSKYMIADYLYEDLSDLKNIPDHILQAKTGAQLLFRKDTKPEVVEALANEVIKRSPQELNAIKIYLRAQYKLDKDFSETGPIYSYVSKAYSLAPHDTEVLEFLAYATLMSKDGLYKLSQINSFKDKYYIFYFYAWANWKNKTNLDRVKQYLTTGYQHSNNYKGLFQATLKEVNDPNVSFGQAGVFSLNFDPLSGVDF